MEGVSIGLRNPKTSRRVSQLQISRLATDHVEAKGFFRCRITKTTGSFDRALKRFEVDCRLLNELPAAS